ncbi:MAG TPA: LacI family DNA-binding transcriptional regulator [Euzebya sp.]|nr:LacI family DNA-binding transcriptional regulator [Euzebya sp.]
MSPPRAGRPTIIDVAKAAGVSKSLVSLVMRGAPNVSPSSRAAVLQAAERLGYRPNAVARSLVQGRSYVIGVMVSDLANPFFIDVIAGATDAAYAADHRALINTGGRDEVKEADAIDTLLRLQVDGIVVAGAIVDPAVLERVGADTPTVITNRASRSKVIDSIVIDDRGGNALAVDHLVELGHRRIAHISGGRGAGARNRLTGYRQAMSRHGLESYGTVVPGSYTERGGADGIAALLAIDHRPTAIIAPNDVAAVGALEALTAEGLDVPGDISLVGFDDTYLAGLGHIDLTSVRQDAALMGARAVEMLIERADGRRSRTRHLMLEPSLTIRSSTAPPPRTS